MRDKVNSGQGIGICSDILVERELAAGTLAKALDPSLPGLGYYLLRPSSRRTAAPSIPSPRGWRPKRADGDGGRIVCQRQSDCPVVLRLPLPPATL